MTFDVVADSYDRFMGRFSEPLAEEFVGQVQLTGTERALDVGAGPGALTDRLVRRLGAARVSTIDPSPPFVAALRARFPDVEARTGGAEDLPWPDHSFDVTLAQLVVHFMTDPVAGLREMARVTRRGGQVAACVWDHAGGGSPLSTFWTAVHDLDPGARNESGLAGAREGHLAELAGAAGLEQVASSSLTVRVGFADLEDWWQPFTLGVGPAGSYVAALDAGGVARLRRHCAELLPSGAFEVAASAWCVRARVR